MRGKLLFIISVMIPFFVLMGSPQIADSQVVRKKPPTVTKTPPVVPPKSKLIFEGKGIVPGGATNFPLTGESSRQPLTMEEKKAALIDAMKASGITVNANNFPVAKWAVLNAQTMLVENRAAFVFEGHLSIYPTVPKIRLDEGFLRLFLKPDKIDGWYLIDCSVFGFGSNSFINNPYEITGPDGNKMTVSNRGEDHLQMFMVSKNLEWQHFLITRKGSFEISSCEVTLAGK